MNYLYSKRWDRILADVGVFLQRHNLIVGAFDEKKKRREGKTDEIFL